MRELGITYTHAERRELSRPNRVINRGPILSDSEIMRRMTTTPSGRAIRSN